MARKQGQTLFSQAGVLVFVDGDDTIAVKDEAHHGADLVPERPDDEIQKQDRRGGERRGGQHKKEPALRHLPPPEKDVAWWRSVCPPVRAGVNSPKSLAGLFRANRSRNRQ